MRNNAIRQIVVVLALVATVAINGLANALPLNGQTTGEISDRFDVYFVPAGYVFSIWGLIYLALAAYAVYQALPAQRDNQALQSTGYLFVLSSVANIAWLFFWHYELFTLSLVAMVALLLSLIGVYLRLGIGRNPAPVGERWLVRVPFSIYLGWITVATIANATSLLDYLGWSGWGIGPEAWMVVILIVATCIAGTVIISRADVAYALVLLWAYVGIAVKHAATPVVANATWMVTGVVVVVLVIGVILKQRRMKATV